MPGFIYTVIAVDAALWVLWARRFFYTKPDDIRSVVIFLLFLYAALSLLFSLPVYFYKERKAPKLSNLKIIYRKSLKWALWFSFGIVGILVLKAFGLANVLNTALFAALHFVLFLQLKRSR